MKLKKIGYLILVITIMNSCSSTYEMINPDKLYYTSGSSNSSSKNKIAIDYKYDLLNKRYSKKERKKGIKLVAVKITNNSNQDVVLGEDIKLVYNNGEELDILKKENILNLLKQQSMSYALYLLLSPMNFAIIEGGRRKNIRIGLVIGPGIAIGNIIASSSENRKFLSELSEFDINGETIKKGETKFGLIGVKSIKYRYIGIKTNE